MRTCARNSENLPLATLPAFVSGLAASWVALVVLTNSKYAARYLGHVGLWLKPPASTLLHSYPFTMQALTPHLVTQFTEDAQATEDRTCGHLECKCEKKLIQKGEPIHYIASLNPAQPGKFVCDNCLVHYQKTLATTMRQSTGASSKSVCLHGYNCI